MKHENFEGLRPAPPRSQARDSTETSRAVNVYLRLNR